MTPDDQSTEQHAQYLRELAKRRVQPLGTNVSDMSLEEVGRRVYELQIHQEELDIQNEELRRVQLDVQTSRDRYADLYDFAPVGYLTLDDLGNIAEANVTLAAMLGVDRSRLVGTRLALYCDTASRTTLHAHLEKNLASETHHSCELLFYTQRGNELYARLDSESTEASGAVQIRAALTDVGEQHKAKLALDESEKKLREMEAHLAHVSRLSTMGEMLAGIAHEINQPLYAIANYAQATSNLVRNADTHHDPLIDTWQGKIKQQAERCGEIVRGLQKFVKKKDGDRHTRDLNQIVRDSIQLIKADTRYQSVSFECRPPDPGPQVYASDIQLQQVLVNLLRNACEATSEASTPRIVLDLTFESGRVRLSVEDNGPGVELSQRPHLFEAFYSTKPDGMGMGLAISRSIVEAHDGTLSFAPGTFSGAKFVIELPAAVAAKGQEP